jgi:hypothetical protein
LAPFSAIGVAASPPGDLYYVAGAVHYDEKSKRLVGYHRHGDVEHAHETWVEVE